MKIKTVNGKAKMLIRRHFNFVKIGPSRFVFHQFDVPSDIFDEHLYSLYLFVLFLSFSFRSEDL